MKKSFDHLLRETLQGPAPEPPHGCLDAGVLAAWFEGTLDPGERAVAEAHAADCSRCQAALAAMIRSEPPIESRPWWRSPAFGWLVPITVAAAALVLFVQPYWHRTAPQVAVQHAPATIAPPAEQAPPPKTETLADNPAVPAATPPAPAVEARSRDAARFEPAAKAQGGSLSAAATPAVPPAPVEATPLKDRVGVPIEQLTLQKAASAAAAAPAPPPAASERRTVVATGPPAAAPASPTRPAEDRSAGAPAMIEKSVAEAVMLTTRTAATQQPAVVVRSPEGSTRWWITKPGSVQRSNDAGTTWASQATGVSAVITSGAAPSDSVCWLVGRSGVVLQSTDGRSWRRVPFPQAVDLVAISAADERFATVTTIDGRTFTTADAGKTWK